MTASLKQLPSYGPRQFADRIDFAEWQFDRALRLGLIPAAQGGRWAAAVVNAVTAQPDAVRAAVGSLPDVGATRAEEHLAEKFDGVTVHPGTAAELSRRGHLPACGEYKGHTLYCGLTLERFTDRRKVAAASTAGHIYTRDGAARFLDLRPVDFDHLLRAGLLTHSDTTVSTWYKDVVVCLYRQADLNRVKRLSRIDWAAVRATPKGRPSPLAQLPTRAARTARAGTRRG